MRVSATRRGGRLRLVAHRGGRPPALYTSYRDFGRFPRLSGVDARYFEVLGVSPRLGRFLSAEDERPGVPPVVVLGHALWRTRFADDQGILDRTIRLDGHTFQVIGVAPEASRD